MGWLDNIIGKGTEYVQTRKAIREELAHLKKAVGSSKELQEAIRQGRFDVEKAVDTIGNAVMRRTRMTPERWNEIRPDVRKKVREAVGLSTNEGRAVAGAAGNALNNAADKPESFLEKAKAKIKGFFGKFGLSRSILVGATSVLGFFGIKINEAQMNKLCDFLGIKDVPKTGDTTKKPAPAPANQPPATAEKPEVKYKNLIALFKTAGWEMDLTSAEKDNATLVNSNYRDIEGTVRGALDATNGKLYKVLKAIKDANLPAPAFKPRLADTMFIRWDISKIDRICKVIQVKGKTDKPLNNADTVRGFLDAMNGTTDATFEATIKQYEPPAPTVATTKPPAPATPAKKPTTTT